MCHSIDNPVVCSGPVSYQHTLVGRVLSHVVPRAISEQRTKRFRSRLFFFFVANGGRFNPFGWPPPAVPPANRGDAEQHRPSIPSVLCASSTVPLPALHVLFTVYANRTPSLIAPGLCVRVCMCVFVSVEHVLHRAGEWLPGPQASVLQRWHYWQRLTDTVRQARILRWR